MIRHMCDSLHPVVADVERIRLGERQALCARGQLVRHRLRRRLRDALAQHGACPVSDYLHCLRQERCFSPRTIAYVQREFFGLRDALRRAERVPA